MNEEYDTIQLTQEDLIESLQINVNDLNTRSASIIEQLSQGLQVEPHIIEDAERVAAFIASNLSELRIFIEEGKE